MIMQSCTVILYTQCLTSVYFGIEMSTVRALTFELSYFFPSRIVRHVILSIVCYIVSTLRSSLPFMTGLTSFALTLCILSWYQGELEANEKHNDVITKLVYITRANIWSMLPVVIGRT